MAIFHFCKNANNFLGNSSSTIPRSQTTLYKINYCYRIRTSYKLILHQVVTFNIDPNGGVTRSLVVHTDISHLMDSGNFRISYMHLDNGPSFMTIDPFKNSLEQAVRKAKFIKEDANNDSEKNQIMIGSSSFGLTKQKLIVLQHLSEGDTVKAISKKMILSEHTIRTRRNNIRKKLNCKNTIEAVVKALKAGLI